MKQQYSASGDTQDSLVAEVTDEFMDRVRIGQHPDVEEYAQRYPQVGDVLRKILPAVKLMHQSEFRSQSGGAQVQAGPLTDGALGDYRLLREIGRGGMGIVYEAEQISLNRRVALKVLSFAAALDSRRLERFKKEAQAAGQLHHSNIVPVYAVGCERGVWYYAMQMIEGQSLAEVVDQLRTAENVSAGVRFSDARTLLDVPGKTLCADDGQKEDQDEEPMGIYARLQSEQSSVDGQPQTECGPSQSLKTTCQVALSTANSTRDQGFIRKVVELGIQAAEALEHAHAMDIVHRDIKPGNLMIDTRGHLWVTDFGLAQCREETGLTMTGDLLGTLGYMSPEQASGRRGVVDQRTDIYSLGATLYELLTLHPAFDGSSRAALLQKIANDEPVPPRKHNNSIPVDLETIVLKAMAREAGSRYSTARELADDLRRFCDSRPILARRPSLIESTSKWIKRHSALVASAVISMLLLSCGLIVSTVLIAQEQLRTQDALVEVQSRQKDTERALLAEAEQRRLAEENFQQAREMLDFFLNTTEEKLADHREFYEIRSELLVASLNYYQDFIVKAENNRPLQAQLASSHQRVARILHRIGFNSAAETALENALLTQERLVQENPRDRDLRRGLFGLYVELGSFRGNGPIYLAGDSRVHEELKMTEEQVETATQIAMDYRNLYRPAWFSYEPTEMRKRFRTGTESALHDVRELLTDEQYDRLMQIALQHRGIHAWHDPSVAETLQLSDLQRIELRTISDRQWQDLNRRGHKDSKVHEGCMDYESRMYAVLSEAQVDRWETMTGTPFDGRIDFWQWHNGGRSKGKHKDSQHSD